MTASVRWTFRAKQERSSCRGKKRSRALPGMTATARKTVVPARFPSIWKNDGFPSLQAAGMQYPEWIWQNGTIKPWA
jgi:hypothetical protein